MPQLKCEPVEKKMEGTHTKEQTFSVELIVHGFNPFCVSILSIFFPRELYLNFGITEFQGSILLEYR